MKKRVFLASLIILAVSSLNVLAADAGKPAIKFDNELFDFGQIDEGTTVKHTFKISNNGSAILKLLEAHTTCGCTVAKFTKSSLKPGEFAAVDVDVDTSMKQNAITKTVTISSNDPDRPMVNLDLKMFVKNPHTNLKGDIKAKIFNDDHCASCHVGFGVGKFGGELYNADCKMCHGPKGEGESGPALVGPYDNDAFRAHALDVLSNGSKNSNAMPGFLAESGGPLSKEQVDSVVVYLRKMSQARKLSK